MGTDNVLHSKHLMQTPRLTNSDSLSLITWTEQFFSHEHTEIFIKTNEMGNVIISWIQPMKQKFMDN